MTTLVLYQLSHTDINPISNRVTLGKDIARGSRYMNKLAYIGVGRQDPLSFDIGGGEVASIIDHHSLDGLAVGSLHTTLEVKPLGIGSQGSCQCHYKANTFSYIIHPEQKNYFIRYSST